MALSVGGAIFVAVKPITKIVFTVGAGALLSKKGVLDVVTCRKLAAIIINVFVPALIFNKVLNAFDSDNMGIAGVCVLTSLFYIILGGAMALAMRYLTPMPKYWRGGAIACTMWSNSGDLPMAYITSIGNSIPFVDGDEDKGVAFVSIIMSVYMLTMWTCGGIQLVERDFVHQANGDYEAEEEDDVEKLKTQAAPAGLGAKLRRLWPRRGSTASTASAASDTTVAEPAPDAARPVVAVTPAEDTAVSTAVETEKAEADDASLQPVQSYASYTLSRRLSRRDAAVAAAYRGGVAEDVEDDEPSGDGLDPILSAVETTAEAHTKHSHRPGWAWLVVLLKNVAQPPSASLIVAVILAVIPPVKRLFVATSFKLHDAPDELPPLDFFMNFCLFVGNATVPCGLLVLGATIGRLQIRRLPGKYYVFVAIMTVLKLVVLPIIAVAWCNRLRAVGWIGDDDKMLYFVLIVSASVPASTSQVYLSTYFAPEDGSGQRQMDMLAISLIVQYIALLVTLAVVVTYVLKVQLGA
ncbi:auxin efflux carrier [Dipodascopsis tothii]|uniref:auxin efflux carrier n=1 Tax=Dipodascopsis tothii TaxID=44089 RepID=UPI0034CF0691